MKKNAPFARLEIKLGGSLTSKHVSESAELHSALAECNTTVTDLPDLHMIHVSIQEENLLGVGGNGIVYKIVGSDNFVIKVGKHRVPGAEAQLESGTPLIIEDAAFQGKNFGQPIAQYDNGTVILRRQYGIPVGVPPYLRKYGKRNPEYQAVNDHRYEASTQEIASMPQIAYRALLEDVIFLNDNGKTIDPSKSSNMLYDLADASFKLVDIGESRSKRNYPSHLLVMLFDNSNSHSYKGAAEQELKIARQNILDKLISAATDLKIPFVAEKQDVNIGGVAYALTLAGYAEGTAERVQIIERILATTSSKPAAKSSLRPSIATRPR